MSPRASPFVLMVYIFGTVILLLTLYYSMFSLSGFGVNKPVDIYWLDLNNTTLRPLLSLLLIPLVASAFVVLGVKRHITSKFYWLGVIFLWLVNLMACGSSYAGILRTYNELSQMEVDQKTYYALSSYGTVGIGHPRPIIDIYECDQLSLFCFIIYTYECGYDCEGEYWLDWKVQFVPDTQTEKLTVLLNKHSIYKHPISP